MARSWASSSTPRRRAGGDLIEGFGRSPGSPVDERPCSRSTIFRPAIFGHGACACRRHRTAALPGRKPPPSADVPFALLLRRVRRDGTARCCPVLADGTLDEDAALATLDILRTR